MDPHRFQDLRSVLLVNKTRFWTGIRNSMSWWNLEGARSALNVLPLEKQTQHCRAVLHTFNGRLRAGSITDKCDDIGDVILEV